MPACGGMRTGESIATPHRAHVPFEPLRFSWDPEPLPKVPLSPDIGHSIIRDKVTPGYSESSLTCGEFLYWKVCRTHSNHPKKAVLKHCKRPGCPTCYQTWASREARSATDLIQAYKDLTGNPYAVRHVALSPPADMVASNGFTWASTDALNWLYDEGNRVQRLLGVTGCLVVPHPYRIKREYWEYIASRKETTENRYEWVMRQDNWDEYVYFSPHLHLFAFGKFMDYKTFKDLTGWLYHNIGYRTGKSLEKSLRYVLTHAWVKGNNKILRAWGSISNRNLGSEIVSKYWEEDVCDEPGCGSLMDRVTIDDTGGTWILGTAFHRVIIKRYFIREKKRKSGG